MHSLVLPAPREEGRLQGLSTLIFLSSDVWERCCGGLGEPAASMERGSIRKEEDYTQEGGRKDYNTRREVACLHRWASEVVAAVGLPVVGTGSI